MMMQTKKKTGSDSEIRDSIQHGSANIEYYIIRTGRIKTSEVIVDSDRIEVRTPVTKSLEDTRNLIRDKAEWILKRQYEYRHAIPQITKPTFKENSTLPYLGRNYPLRINKNQAKNRLRFIDNEFMVDITDADLTKESKFQIRELYKEWLNENAYPILWAKVQSTAKKLGVTVQRISIKKNLKSRWGSVTRNNTINFNVNLIKAPEDIIDYIVLHEVCHLEIRGHSHHYWELVHRFMPNYQEKIDWLNINGTVLVDNNDIV
jgi:predicted metal-dependent hydrolase